MDSHIEGQVGNRDCIGHMDCDALLGKDCIGERIGVGGEGSVEPLAVGSVAPACGSCLAFAGMLRIVNVYQGRRPNSGRLIL